jgi:hypothetical protein
MALVRQPHISAIGGSSRGPATYATGCPGLDGKPNWDSHDRGLKQEDHGKPNECYCHTEGMRQPVELMAETCSKQ